jgi:hypothetical protein
MIHIAAERLDGTKPIPARIGKIFYHAEAITLAVTPAAALAPIRAALAVHEQLRRRRVSGTVTGRVPVS